MPRADDRRASWQPVRCARCGAAVSVAKFSPQHTSVQWTAAAARACAEFGARGCAGDGAGTGGGGAGVGAGGGPIEGCGALRDSIEAALAAGQLSVCPPSYE
jgi:hypothetical protein